MCKNSGYQASNRNFLPVVVGANGENVTGAVAEGEENERVVEATSSDSLNSHPTLPKVLQALGRLERKAENDYASIQTSMEQIEKIENILTKLVATHFDSDNYVDYLFKRAEQLAAHLETYKNIVGKIDIGLEIRTLFKQMSREFIEYLQRKLEFKTIWFESMQIIECGKQTIQDKVEELRLIKPTVDGSYEKRDYFELRDLKIKFNDDLNSMNDLVDNCFKCGQQSKELSTALHDKLIVLEANFQRIVKESMNRINEIKTSTSSCATKTTASNHTDSLPTTDTEDADNHD